MHLYVEPMDAVVIDVSEDGRIRLANEDWSQPTLQERRAVIYAARDEIATSHRAGRDARAPRDFQTRRTLMQLTGTVALLTGGKRIGAVVADALARQGVDVALGYARSRAEAERTVTAIDSARPASRRDSGRFVAARSVRRPSSRRR